MPLPDWMQGSSTPAPKASKPRRPKKSSGGSSRSYGSTGSSSSSSPTGRGADLMYDRLNKQPLPTQGYVADLVDILSFGAKPTSYDPTIGGLLSEPKESKFSSSQDVTAEAVSTKVLREALAQKGAGAADFTPEAIWASQNLTEVTRELRERAMGEPGPAAELQGKVAEKPGKVKPMTWEEYNNLTDRQRAAVDFNSMLVQAVRKDRKMNKLGKYDDVDEQERATYNMAVDKMFGHERGSDTYAPETVAMLDQIKLKDSDADLDDFLGLKAAITESDLDMLKIKKANEQVKVPTLDEMVTPAPEAQPTLREERLELVEHLAEQTDAMQEQMARGNQILQTFRMSAAAGRSQTVEMFGGVTSPVKPGYGFGAAEFDERGVPQNIDAYFQHEYQLLADKREDPNRILAAINETLTPDEIEAFYSYVDTRSREATQHDVPLGKGKQYRTPEEFRKIFGLEK